MPVSLSCQTTGVAVSSAVDVPPDDPARTTPAININKTVNKRDVHESVHRDISMKVTKKMQLYSSTSVGATARCELSPVEQYLSIIPYHQISPFSHSQRLTLSDPTSNFVRQYDFPVPLRCRKRSDTVLVAFVRPLSEPVRRFSSCSTDFSQQIAQVVRFLFLCVFLF
jgi:hypothetical protein